MEPAMRRLMTVLMITAAAQLSLPAAVATARPAHQTFRFHGSAQTTFTFDVTCTEPGSVVPGGILVTGSGVFTKLGRATITVEETSLFLCDPATGPVPIQLLTAASTYVAANGDVLYANSVRVTPIDPATLTFTSYDEFAGGTGRFAQATGSIEVFVAITPAGTARFDVHGHLTLRRW
jgi:hypothetical protein